MTNLWPAINNLRMEATRLRQTSRRAEAAEGMDIAASVLEAAGEMPQAKERLLPHFDEELAHIQCFYCKGIRALLAALPDEEKP